MSYCTVDEFKSDLIFAEISLSMKRYIVTFLLGRISAESGVSGNIFEVTCYPATIKYYVRLKICHTLA